MKSKVDNVDKLIPVPVDLSRLSDVVKIDLFKKNVYNAKIKNTEDKIPDIIILATKSILNAKINEVKEEITKIINLAPTGSYTAVGNKIPSVNNLTITQKLMKLKRNLLIIIMINILLLQNLIS